MRARHPGLYYNKQPDSVRSVQFQEFEALLASTTLYMFLRLRYIPFPTDATGSPAATSRQRCFRNRLPDSRSSPPGGFGPDHRRSATIVRSGQMLLNTFETSVPSPHMQASPPTIRARCSSEQKCGREALVSQCVSRGSTAYALAGRYLQNNYRPKICGFPPALRGTSVALVKDLIKNIAPADAGYDIVCPTLRDVVRKGLYVTCPEV